LGGDEHEKEAVSPANRASFALLRGENERDVEPGKSPKEKEKDLVKNREEERISSDLEKLLYERIGRPALNRSSIKRAAC